MDMGDKIRELRTKKNMTLEQLGDLVGVGKSTVRKWENGMIANMRRDKIAKIADALGVSPAYLMGWDEVKPSDQSKHNYYLDDDTAAMAQALFEDKNYRLLFDAARDSRPEDLQMVADMLNRLKATNPEG